MQAPFRPLPVAIVIFLTIAVGLMNVPAFAQGSGRMVPAGVLRPASPPQHAGSHPGMPAAQPVIRPYDRLAPMALLAERFALLKDQLGRLIRETALKLLSDNKTNLLSGNSPKLLSDNEPEILSRNSPKLLSENEPKILSNNKTPVLSGNKTAILSGNHISLFSGLKIEIHIENSGNHNPPPPHPAK
jgi:hypothetical protein